MTDVALSLLALIAGGLTLELFGAALPPQVPQDHRGLAVSANRLEVLEEVAAGNPS